MKRWPAWTIITCYLSALFVGVASHAMNSSLISHPAAYYFVWDMFCGWSAQELRYHLIGEGEDGTFYQLSPAPWNTFAPYGDLERGQYDTLGHCHVKIAVNTLKHTDHPPINRIFLVEEMWPKKFNLPDYLWAWRFDEPKDPHSYFWNKATFDSDGNILDYKRDIITNFQEIALTDNPRLKTDSMRGKPFIAVSSLQRTQATLIGDGLYRGAGSPSSSLFDAGNDTDNGGSHSTANGELRPSAN